MVDPALRSRGGAARGLDPGLGFHPKFVCSGKKLGPEGQDLPSKGGGPSRPRVLKSGPRAAPPRGSSAGSGSWAMIPSQIGMFRQEARSWGEDLPSRGGGPSHPRVWKSGPRAAPPRRTSVGSGSKSSLIMRCPESARVLTYIMA